MKWIFSDRLAPWSLAAALALFTLLVGSANRTLEGEYTGFARCLALPEACHDAKVRFLGATVLDRDRILDEEIEITISPIQEARPGMRLDAIARFDRSGRFIIESYHLYEYNLTERILMYAVSLPVFCIILFLITRRFRSSLPGGLFESREADHA